MKVVIFAGGVGSRLWPLSRKNSPKQFEKIINDKSTLQQTVERLLPEFSYDDIYIATGKRYEKIVLEQLPNIPRQHFIFEPEMRDVGPAIGLVSLILAKKYPNEPTAILWSDHLVKNIEAFKRALKVAEEIIKNKKSEFIFIAQKPRFANQNLGWIELGEEIKNESDEKGINVYDFKRLIYRPSLSEAENFLKSKNYVWNLGYFVTTPAFLASLYEKYMPEMYNQINLIKESWETENYEKTLDSVYPLLEKIAFDNAILEKMEKSNIMVISSDLEWSDVGAWEALKEALCESAEENLTKGKVLIVDSRDSLAFNYTEQLLVGIDLDEILVINTNDVILVCPKTSVPKIKKLVESLAGTPHEHLA